MMNRWLCPQCGSGFVGDVPDNECPVCRVPCKEIPIPTEVERRFKASHVSWSALRSELRIFEPEDIYLHAKTLGRSDFVMLGTLLCLGREHLRRHWDSKNPGRISRERRERAVALRGVCGECGQVKPPTKRQPKKRRPAKVVDIRTRRPAG